MLNISYISNEGKAQNSNRKHHLLADSWSNHFWTGLHRGVYSLSRVCRTRAFAQPRWVAAAHQAALVRPALTWNSNWLLFLSPFLCAER